jgi:hypothetical protein
VSNWNLKKMFPKLPIVFQFFGEETITNKIKAGDIIKHNDAKASDSTTIDNHSWEKMQ